MSEANIRSGPQQIQELERRLRATPRHRRPLEHAALRYSLGMAWAENPTGERAINLSRAIAAYEDAAELFNPDRFPVEHARVQNARGAALRELGEHHAAAAAFERALDLLRGTPAEGRGAEYGAALNNLGLVKSALGDHEGAVAALKDAVAAFAAAGETRQRLMAFHNLGQAQAAADDHRAAIASYEQGLDLAEADEVPYQWALLQHGLGVSLTAVDEATRAADAFRESLRAFTRTRYPFQYALAKNNLGLACAQIGDLTSLRQAVAAFSDALRVLDVRLHRQQWEQAYRNLQLAEKALEDQGHPGTRAEHFVELAVALPGDERRELVRERLMTLLELPEPQRTEALVELDVAALRLPQDTSRRVTAAWLQVLMELPNELLIVGLKARLVAMDHLDTDEEREAAGEVLEIAIREELLAPQRIKVRDTLEMLGYERQM